MSNLKLYSKTSIFLFSLFGTAFYAAILYSTNLKRVGEGRSIFSTILFAMAWNYVLPHIASKIGLNLKYSFFLVNAAAGLIFVYVLWDKQIPKDAEYRSESILIPLSMLIALFAIVFILNYLNYH
ncbi:MAG: hypothetical protein H6595_06775 [Flavobacteriales bacterium]|nr:hypothetical protein [Flavobacteriales bacterium]MCB9167169.1 hypothetical protein [Flavobacteriales bacterium]